MARIAFITPSSGQGHGIGDYTRLIGEECVRLGHEVQIVALNEPHWDSHLDEVLPAAGKTMEAHRWGQHLPYERKCREAHAMIKSFQPDWISLQFEYYCYANHGNLSGLARYLPPLLRGYRLHLMMHELWTLLNAAGDWREQVKGTIRYLQYRYLVKKIKPDCVHTSGEAYARKIRPLLPGVKLLPIPSNIHVDRKPGFSLPPEITKTMAADRLKYLFVILFGRVIPEWDGRDCLKAVDEFARRISREVRLISIGSCGYNDLYWKQLLEQMPPDWQSIKLGIREPDFISQMLQACDLGISNTAFSLSRKSGTTAAFLEHGLPVLFAGKMPSLQEINLNYPDLYRGQLYFSDQVLPADIVAKKLPLAEEAYSTVVTRRFLSDLDL